MLTTYLSHNMKHIRRPKCKWIIGLGATKHMTSIGPHLIHIYEIIAMCDVHLGDVRVVEVI
jgi:hypothetical protein